MCTFTRIIKQKLMTVIKKFHQSLANKSRDELKEKFFIDFNIIRVKNDDAVKQFDKSIILLYKD